MGAWTSEIYGFQVVFDPTGVEPTSGKKKLSPPWTNF